jgi:hypothetical protein
MIAPFTQDEINREILVVTTDVEEISRRLEASLAGAEREADREVRRIEGALVAMQSRLRARQVMARSA